MSGFNGINQFGSLIINGQKLTFEDFDKDKNGEVTQDEYNNLLNEVKLDSVDFSSIDKDGDNAISEDEMAVYEQKTLMQDAINNMSKTISLDFAGKSDFLAELNTALKDLIDDFAANFSGDIENMAKEFETQLPDKYEALKETILADDPDTIKSDVLDEIYGELVSPEETRGPDGEIIKGDALPDTTAKRIAKELEAEADKFIKDYTGDNLAEDLKTHLEDFMNKSDAEKLQEAADAFKEGANSFGAMIDNGADLTALKEYAKEFLLAALDAGVTVKLGGTTIKTEAAITTALKKFTDGDELKTAVEDVIAGLNTTTLKESIIAEEEQKAQDAADKAFTDIKGEAYQVNAGIIDFSGIPGYFENTQIHERGKGWGGSKDKAFAKGQEILNNESLKSQMKAQIEQMLAEKGISFDKIAAVFENVYNQSITDTLNAEGMITGRGARGLSRKGHAYLNTKDCVDAFITTFNTNIAKAIDEMNASNKDFDTMNASNKDFDTIDLDYTQAGKDENGNTITDEATGTDISTLYASGKTIVTFDKGADYYVTLAEIMVDNMKSQMLKKAKAMCDANGIEFDNSAFNSIFNNAKSTAVNQAVSGSSWGFSLHSEFNTISFDENGNPIYKNIENLANKNTVCYLDTKTLLNTFTEQFKTNYTSWVNLEKNE